MHEDFFFRATNFPTKNAPKFSPKFLSLCSVGQKNPGKFPPNFPLNFPNFPAKRSKKIHRRAFAEAQGEVILIVYVNVPCDPPYQLQPFPVVENYGKYFQTINSDKKLPIQARKYIYLGHFCGLNSGLLSRFFLLQDYHMWNGAPSPGRFCSLSAGNSLVLI